MFFFSLLRLSKTIPQSIFIKSGCNALPFTQVHRFLIPFSGAMNLITVVNYYRDEPKLINILCEGSSDVTN